MSSTLFQRKAALLIVIVLASTTGWLDSVLGADELLPSEIDFNFHIKPILSDRCYKCHGPDDNARMTNFRLDLKDGAFAELDDSGEKAFVKGDPTRSVAWKRIHSEDPDYRMPPPASNLSLSSREKALITAWIRQGAKWKQHWAFTPAHKPHVPTREYPEQSAAPGRPNNPIDHFIAARLRERSLHPSPEAEKERLIRRVSFDLTGLPPSLEEIDAFIADTSSGAYEQLVDRLLTTDAYAERMAMEWLDVARYGDSQGMHGDRERYHWPWRDWVITAFKSNMPYDDFIIWQLAGDLLPAATTEQKLATAFHRNHPVSAEGGIIDEEFRVKYVQDRVNTTATAFLGLTLECATCHDHKFDPISQREYYQLSAFFNNLKELGMVAEGGGSSGPVLLLPDAATEQRLADLSREIDRTRERLRHARSAVASSSSLINATRDQAVATPVADAVFPFDSIRAEEIKVEGIVHRVVRNTPIDKIVDDNPQSVASGHPQVVPGRIGNALRFDKEYDLVFLRDDGQFELNQPCSAGAWVRTEKRGENQSIMSISGDLTNSAWRGWDLFLDPQNRPSIRMIGFWPHNYMQITAKATIAKAEWHHVLFTYDGSGQADGIRLFIDGKTADCVTDYDNLYRSIVLPWKEQEGWPQKPVMVGRSGRFYTGDNGVFTGSIDHIQFFERTLTRREVASLYEHQTEVRFEPQALTEADHVDHAFHRNHPEVRADLEALRELLGRKLELLAPVPEIMVMADMSAPRRTYVLSRGQYNAPTVQVKAGVPEVLLAYSKDLPKNRLGLARWLVDPGNPLTARVTVNRYWQMIFGRGIVDTPEDFGTQGALPSHPQLLDWLAVDFVESGWDVGRLLRTMVTSATYRQSSVTTREHREIDAANIYLARGPSYRLPAEMIRDNALAASGLLTRRVGGPSVKPYQPQGLWVEKTGPGSAYQHDSGERLYRRSMYTFIRRTTPHPAMIAFDAPNRSVCIVRRERTNTPLQALVLLNDPQFVECARMLAQRVQHEGGARIEDQVRYAFRLLCGRRPTTHEMTLMKTQYQSAAKKFTAAPEEADAILRVGDYPFDDRLDKVATAALTLVANTVMNFDEAYMKR